ncbi:hypothetical protein D3C76_97370 [compost metagenome]
MHHERVYTLRRDASQTVNLGVTQHLGVLNGSVDAGTELLDPFRQAGDTTLTLSPVASGQIEEHLLQLVAIKAGADLLYGVIVGEQVLDTTEPGLGGGFKTVQEVHLGEQHGQVSGKTRHDRLRVSPVAGWK